jgi:DNA-binding MarR family transcriptional regulator
LVQRVIDTNDRRVYSVRLTPAGRKVFSKMAAVHEEWIAELLGGLPAPDKSQLYTLLSRLKQQLPS